MSDDEKVHTLVGLDMSKSDLELADDILDAFEAMGVEVDRDDPKARVKKGVERIIAKHEGPGPHDTGTPQAAHAGGSKSEAAGKGALIKKPEDMSLFPKGVAPPEERERSLLEKFKRVIDINSTGVRSDKSGAQGIGIIELGGEHVLVRRGLKDTPDYQPSPYARGPVLENLGWRVAKTLGLGNLFPAIHYKDLGDGRGTVLAYQEHVPSHRSWVDWDSAGGNDTFVDDRGQTRPVRIKYTLSDAARVASAYDFITGNGDRHSGNWMVGPDLLNNPDIRLIDQGLVLSTGSWNGDFNDFWRDNTDYSSGAYRGSYTVDASDLVDPDLSYKLLESNALAADFDDAGLSRRYEQMMARAKRYRDSGVIPEFFVG